jgi:hypothetical protein
MLHNPLDGRSGQFPIGGGTLVRFGFLVRMIRFRNVGGVVFGQDLKD